MPKPSPFFQFHLVASVLAIVLCLALGLTVFSIKSTSDVDDAMFKRRLAEVQPSETRVLGSCTVFLGAFGDRVLFGNNEDFTNYNTFYWTDPAKDGKYGGLYIGFDDYFPQGGINEKGLMFDYTSLPGSTILPHPERPHREPEIYNMHHWSEPSKVMTIMRHAATVEEAIAVASTYDWSGTLLWQVLLADAKGDAVIISAGPDGELAFTRKPAGDGFMVAGNFNAANPTNRYSPDPCPKVGATAKTLREIQAEGSGGLTVDRFRAMLKAVHADGRHVNTVYSNIMDPKAGKVYLYYWHQFGQVVELDVAAEIARGTEATALRGLFPGKTVKVADLRHFYYRNSRVIKATALAVVLASLFSGVVLFRKRGWLPARL